MIEKEKLKIIREEQIQYLKSIDFPDEFFKGKKLEPHLKYLNTIDREVIERIKRIIDITEKKLRGKTKWTEK